jgi:uncharacterized phiE125 gp8 family phage protein
MTAMMRSLRPSSTRPASARKRLQGGQLLQATWELRLDELPCGYEIQIPKPPLVSVTSFSYIDTAGNTQVWSALNYQVDAPTGPYADRGRIQPAYATNWPAARTDTMNAVTIRFVAGYGTQPITVPQTIRQAMLLMITTWYECRDELVLQAVTPAPLGALALLTPFKVYE